MNEQVTELPTQEQSGVKEALKRTGKVIGGLVLGVATGYALAKGVEQIIPIDGDTDADAAFEGAAMIGSGIIGTLIGSEV